MNYVKSVLAGLVAVVVICGILPALALLTEIFLLALKGMRDGGFGIAFGPIKWHAPSLRQWLFMFAAFAVGFLWELWRLTRRRSQPPNTATP
jgi:membrane-associated protease RseP (regulator of RpoE activity)